MLAPQALCAATGFQSLTRRITFSALTVYIELDSSNLHTVCYQKFPLLSTGNGIHFLNICHLFLIFYDFFSKGDHYAESFIRFWLFCADFCTVHGVFPHATSQKKTFYAMNTTMEFTVYSSASLVDDAEALINSLEDELSVTKDTSEIAQINQNGSGTVTGSTADLMGKALAMCSRTNGTLDISVYPIVRAWGFTTGSYKVPSEEELTSLLPLVDYTNVQYDEVTGEVILPAGMEIDLGSIAKGYAGQQAAELLREKGVTSALLNLGGRQDLLAHYGSEDRTSGRQRPACRDGHRRGRRGVRRAFHLAFCDGLRKSRCSLGRKQRL